MQLRLSISIHILPFTFKPTIRLHPKQTLEDNTKVLGILAEENTAQYLVSSFSRRFGERLKILIETQNELMKIDGLKEKLNEFCVNVECNDEVRFLRPGDYSSWFELMGKFQEEIRISSDPEELQERIFESEVELKHIWGYLKGSELICIVRLNSCTRTGGCFGGLYNKPEFRGRGIAKILIRQALSDCAKIHDHAHNVLFTGAANFSALNLYYSIGYLKIGQIKICFFDYNNKDHLIFK